MTMWLRIKWWFSEERRWLRNFQRQAPAFEKAEKEFIEALRRDGENAERPKE